MRALRAGVGLVGAAAIVTVVFTAVAQAPTQDRPTNGERLPVPKRG